MKQQEIIDQLFDLVNQATKSINNNWITNSGHMHFKRNCKSVGDDLEYIGKQISKLSDKLNEVERD